MYYYSLFGSVPEIAALSGLRWKFESQSQKSRDFSALWNEVIGSRCELGKRQERAWLRGWEWLGDRISCCHVNFILTRGKGTFTKTALLSHLEFISPLWMDVATPPSLVKKKSHLKLLKQKSQLESSLEKSMLPGSEMVGQL